MTVEFATAEQARGFHPLACFGPEVTAEPLYTNHSLALHGVDETPAFPLSDAALASLIDTLDGASPSGRGGDQPTHGQAGTLVSIRSRGATTSLRILILMLGPLIGFDHHPPERPCGWLPHRSLSSRTPRLPSIEVRAVTGQGSSAFSYMAAAREPG